MHEFKINGSKRKAIKVVGIGAGTTLLPGSWTKPMISAVLLPAHAQTSDDTTPPSAGDLMFSTDANGVVNGIITVTDDVDSSPTINLVTSPSRGNVVFANAKSDSVSSETAFTYTATDGSSFTGEDSFTFRAIDASGNQSPVYTVSISSAPLVDNTAPTGENASVQADSSGVASGTLSANDDTDTNPRVSIVTQPMDGTVMLSGRDFTYTANAGSGFSGNDSFAYKVTDASGNESPAYTVTISASSPTDTTAPIGGDGTARANADGVATGTLFAQDDTDPNPSVVVVDQPSMGTVSLSGRDYTYTSSAGAGFAGDDTFTYKVVDNAGNESPSYTITVSVCNRVLDLGTKTINVTAFDFVSQNDAGFITFDVPMGCLADNTIHFGILPTGSGNGSNFMRLKIRQVNPSNTFGLAAGELFDDGSHFVFRNGGTRDSAGTMPAYTHNNFPPAFDQMVSVSMSTRMFGDASDARLEIQVSVTLIS